MAKAWNAMENANSAIWLLLCLALISGVIRVDVTWPWQF